MAKPETRNVLWLRRGDPIHGERTLCYVTDSGIAWGTHPSMGMA